MKLYIMRHGQAAATAQLPEQTLTREGQAGIERLARMLGRQGIRVGQVFHSGKMRARQTAEIMAAQIAADVEPGIHPHIKPNSDPQQLVNDIDHWHEDTLVVSHLPFIPALLGLLTADAGGSYAITYEPGTIICLSRQNNGWQLEWVEAPHPED